MNLKQITKKALTDLDNFTIEISKKPFDELRIMSETRDFLTQAIEEAVREALEKTKLKKIDAERNTIYTWNEAVSEQERKVRGFLNEN